MGETESGDEFKYTKENLMNHDHKSTNQKYRERYDQIRWDRGSWDIYNIIEDEKKKGPVYGHFM